LEQANVKFFVLLIFFFRKCKFEEAGESCEAFNFPHSDSSIATDQTLLVFNHFGTGHSGEGSFTNPLTTIIFKVGRRQSVKALAFFDKVLCQRLFRYIWEGLNLSEVVHPRLTYWFQIAFNRALSFLHEEVVLCYAITYW